MKPRPFIFTRAARLLTLAEFSADTRNRVRVRIPAPLIPTLARDITSELSRAWRTECRQILIQTTMPLHTVILKVSQ